MIKQIQEVNMVNQDQLNRGKSQLLEQCRALINDINKASLHELYRDQDQAFYLSVMTDLHLKKQFDSMIQNANHLSLDTRLLSEAWNQLDALYTNQLDPMKEIDLDEYVKEKVIHKLVQFEGELQTDYLSVLNDDLILTICAYLDPLSLIFLSEVNAHLSKEALDNSVWKPKLATFFSNESKKETGNLVSPYFKLFSKYSQDAVSNLEKSHQDIFT